MRVLLLGSDGDDKAALAAGLRQSFEWVDVPAAQVAQYMQAGANAAVLIVNVSDGLMPEGRRHLDFAQSARVPVPVVYLSRCDLIDEDDQEIIDLVEMEVRDVLAKCGVGGDATPMARDVGAVAQALGASLPAVGAAPPAPTYAAPPQAAPPHVGAVVCSRCGAPLPRGLGEIQCSYCGTLNLVR